jgi:hypothetical protein
VILTLDEGQPESDFESEPLTLVILLLVSDHCPESRLPYNFLEELPYDFIPA